MIGYENSKYRTGWGNKPSRHAPLNRKLQQSLQQYKRDGRLMPFARAFSGEMLYYCYEQLKTHGGQAAGIDGVTYDDLSPGEVQKAVGKISQCIRNGTYRPHDTRQVQIPKSSGKGYRTLKIKTIFDRVVAKALQTALEPLWEQVFLDGSYGFRPHRNCWKLLADLQARMVRQDRWVLAIDDVRNAFDHVDIETTINTHVQMLDEHFSRQPEHERTDPADGDYSGGTKRKPANSSKGDISQYRDLIATILHGANENRTVGIDQGCPYSPTALNALLHYGHDAPLSADCNTPSCWFRYADNLIYLAADVHEGKTLLDRASRLLEPLGLELKAEDGLYDLNYGDKAQVLGFIIRKQGNSLVFDLSDTAWHRLEEHLQEAHESSNPSAVAIHSIYSWIKSYGPAFRSVRKHVDRIVRLAVRYGFREGISRTRLRRLMQAAYRRWDHISKESLSATVTTVASDGVSDASIFFGSRSVEAGVMDIQISPAPATSTSPGRPATCIKMAARATEIKPAGAKTAHRVVLSTPCAQSNPRANRRPSGHYAAGKRLEAGGFTNPRHPQPKERKNPHLAQLTSRASGRSKKPVRIRPGEYAAATAAVQSRGPPPKHKRHYKLK